MRVPSQILIPALCAALALWTSLWGSVANAQVDVAEPDLKAAIIANMLLFIEWPSEIESEHLSICYMTENAVAKALRRLDGKSVKGKPLKISKIELDQTLPCHALYLGSSDESALSRARTAAGETSSILLIGDTATYFGRGIMINLELVSGRVVFDVDRKSLQNAGLKLSSKALRLARVVVE